ncbi:MAG: sugar phosphate isomerase/epimerase family protein [Oscillospiraceae bacterium]
MDRNIRDRLYISTVASDAVVMAKEYGLGLEIADFCVAANMDESFEPYGRYGVEKMDHGGEMTFHFPFAELCPCAIDPLVRAVTRQRHEQALSLALSHGIAKMIVHAGYIPLVYYPEWFIAESIKYWHDFLMDRPGNIDICLENVMEGDPQMLSDIVKGVDDPRLRICLDVGHASHSVSDTPLDVWIDTLAGYITHVHLHNNDRNVDRHWELGRGTIPMEETICRLIDACPAASFTVECMEAAPSVKWLSEKGFLG